MPPSITDNPEAFFEELNKPQKEETAVPLSPVATPVADTADSQLENPLTGNVEPVKERPSVADDPEAFFAGLTRPLEQKEETPQSVVLNQLAGKTGAEMDDFDMKSLDLLSPKELEEVTNQRRDIPLSENLLRTKFDYEMSLPWNEGINKLEDWKKIGQEVFGGGVSFLKGAQKFAEQSLFSEAEQDPSGWGHPSFKPVKDYVSGIAALPESAAYLFTKLKEGGMGVADRLSESIGVQDREKSYENYKARNLVDRIQAQETQENPSIYSRILKGDMANDALSYVVLNTLPDRETLMAQEGLTAEQADNKRKEIANAIARQTTSEIASREKPADEDIATFATFTAPAGLALGEMGLVSLGLEAGMGLTPKLAQGIKYLGKTDQEIRAMNDAAQALQKEQALQGLEKAQRPSMLGRAAGALATGIENTGAAFAKIGEATPNILKELAPPAIGAVVAGDERRGEGAIVGALLGKAGKPALAALKYAAKTPALIRDIEEARVLSAGASKGTFETLASFPEVSENAAKILRFGGKRLDTTLNNVVEYAKAGVNPTLIALGAGALDSASPEELNKLVSTGLLYGIGGRVVHQAWGKITGVDPVIDARNRRQQDIDDLKTYRDLDPETRKTLDSVTSWDNIVERHTQRAANAEQAYNDAVALGKKDAEQLRKIAQAEKNVLSAVTRANVQTRDEFSRQFVTQLTKLNQLVNGTLRAGQNNVGINILTPDQIIAKFRSDPANATATDQEILDVASQRGFYSTPEGSVEYQAGMGMDAPKKKIVFDRTKPSVVINADALKARMMIEGSTPIDALNHEVGHHVRNIPEFREANKDAEDLLFSQEVKDPAGNVVAVTAGQYSGKDLVDMYLKSYLKGKTPEQIAQLSQLAGLWDYSRGALNEGAVAEYMKDEIIAELNSETFSTHLGKGLDDGVLHMIDVARLKTKKNLLDRAVQKFFGLGGKGEATSDLTGARFSPEVLAANRQAMRALQSLQGEVSQAVKAVDSPKISRSEMLKNKAIRERYGKYAGLFKTKMQGQVFDGNGNPIGAPIDITNPNASEGSWESRNGVTTQLNGYGARPDEVAEASGVVIPDGGRLVVQKQIVTQPDGVTPVMMELSEAKKLQKARAQVIRQSLNTPDEGAPNRFEPVADDSDTWRGTFTPLQIQAIKDMPEGIIPKSIKEHMLKINDMIVRGDGSRMLVDYAAVMNDAGKYTAYSPKIYDVVPIGMHLSSKGNFLVTTISVGRMFDKLNAWSERMPARLAPWGGSKDAFFKEFTDTYLQNWQYREKDAKGNEMFPRGKAGETGISGSPEEALAKKDIFNDFLNLTTNDFRGLNADRTKTPRRRGDVRGKDIDRTIMSMRLDHMAELMDNDSAPKVPINYKNAISNFLPAEGAEPSPAQEERRPTPFDGITAAYKPSSVSRVKPKILSESFNLERGSVGDEVTQLFRDRQDAVSGEYPNTISIKAGEIPSDATKYIEDLFDTYLKDDEVVKINWRDANSQELTDAPQITIEIEDIQSPETPQALSPEAELTASLVASGTSLESFGKGTLIQLAESYGIELPKDAKRGEIIDAINERPIQAPVVEKPTIIPEIIKGIDDTNLVPTPKTGNQAIQGISKKYVESAGIPHNPHQTTVPVNEEMAKRIADYYQQQQDSPNDPAVKKAYTTLAKEVVDQWKAFEEDGYTAEPWTKEGQPYANSGEMMEDVRNNKHIYYFTTESGYGESGITDQMRKQNPMLASSGVDFGSAKNVPANDVFRVVHDIVGHGANGYEFGPKGEFNAYLEHSRMFSQDAKPALAAETLAQNSWVNYGPHLRDQSGNIPKKGEAGYVAVTERPFAEQKNIIIPKEILDEVDKYSQEQKTIQQGGISFMPAKDEKQEVQFKSKPKKGSVRGRTFDLVHFGSYGLKKTSPKKMGKAYATKTDLSGMDKTYFYVNGTDYESQISGGNPYTAKVDGNSIYDLSIDPLGVTGTMNRLKMEEAIQDAGYAGYFSPKEWSGAGFDAVAMFKDVNVTEAEPADIYSKRKLAAINKGKKTSEAPDYAAADAAWEQRMRGMQFMPSSKVDEEYAKSIRFDADPKEARKIVDQAAEKAGYDSSRYWYHGTAGDEFFVPKGRRGVAAHVSLNKDEAWNFAEQAENELEDGGKLNVREWYLKKGELFDPTNEDHLKKVSDLIEPTRESIRNQPLSGQWALKDDTYNPKTWKDKIWDFFEDSEIQKFIKDAGFIGYMDRESPRTPWEDTENAAIFDPNSLKEASLITLDDNRNIIPLSQRFDLSKQDIRFMPESMGDEYVLYHVTPTRNLKKIKQQGLIPKIGPRSKSLGEKEKAIYTFEDLSTADDALQNWLGDEFPEDQKLSLLKISVPKSIKKLDNSAEYETAISETIPANKIQILNEDIMELPSVESLDEMPNTSKQDIRFMPSSKVDEAYASAIESGDMEEAQRLVDEAIKNYGIERITSAASKAPNGQVFEGVAHFESTNKALSELGAIYPNYSDYEDGFTTSKGRFVTRKQALKIQKKYTETRALSNNELSTEYIKSADPATYDNEGKLIPLSQRFDLSKQDIRFMPASKGEYEKVKEKVPSLLPINEQPENLPVIGRLTTGQQQAIDELDKYYAEKTPQRVQELKKDAEESLSSRLTNLGIPVSDSKKIASKAFGDLRKSVKGAMQVISGMGLSDLSRMAGSGRPSVETRQKISPAWLTSAFESFETDDSLALMKAQQVARQLNKADQAKVAAGEDVESAKASGVRQSTIEQGMNFVVGERTADQKAFGSSLREDMDAPPRVYASVVEGQKYGSQGNYNLFFEWDQATPMVITSHHHYGVGNGLTDIHASANIGDKNARSFGDPSSEKYDTLPSGKKVLNTRLLVGNEGASDIRAHQLMVSIPKSGLDDVKRAFKASGTKAAEAEMEKIIASQLVGTPSQGKTQAFTTDEGIPPYVAVQKNRTEAYVLNPDLQNVKRITIVSNKPKEVELITKNLQRAFENNGTKLPKVDVVSKDSGASTNAGRKAITDKFFKLTGKLAFMPETETQEPAKIDWSVFTQKAEKPLSTLRAYANPQQQDEVN